jgi:hypothetical protein
VEGTIQVEWKIRFKIQRLRSTRGGESWNLMRSGLNWPAKLYTLPLFPFSMSTIYSFVKEDDHRTQSHPFMDWVVAQLWINPLNATGFCNYMSHFAPQLSSDANRSFWASPNQMCYILTLLSPMHHCTPHSVWHTHILAFLSHCSYASLIFLRKSPLLKV